MTLPIQGLRQRPLSQSEPPVLSLNIQQRNLDDARNEINRLAALGSTPQHLNTLHSNPRPSAADTPHILDSITQPTYRSASVENKTSGDISNIDPSQKIINAVFGKLKCPISLDSITDPIVLSSGYIFDRQCIDTWRDICPNQDDRFLCPATRQMVKEIPSHDLKYLADNLFKINSKPGFQLPVLEKHKQHWDAILALRSFAETIGVTIKGNLSKCDPTTTDVQKLHPEDVRNQLANIFEELKIISFKSIEDMVAYFDSDDLSIDASPKIILAHKEKIKTLDNLKTLLNNLKDHANKENELTKSQTNHELAVQKLKLKNYEATKVFSDSENKMPEYISLQTALVAFNDSQANLELREKEIEKSFFQVRPGDSPEYDRYANTIIRNLNIPTADIVSLLRPYVLIDNINFSLELKKNMVDWLDGSRDKGSSYGVHINDVWTAIMVGGRLVAAPRIGNNNFDDRVAKLKLSEVEVSGDSEGFSIAPKQPLQTFLEHTELDCDNFDELEAVQRFQTFYIPLQKDENSSVKFSFGFNSYSASKDNPVLLLIVTESKTCIYFVDQPGVQYYDGYVSNTDGVKLTPFEIMNTKKFQQQFNATQEQVKKSKFFKIMTIPLIKKDEIGFTPTAQCSSLSQMGNEVATQLNSKKEKDEKFLELKHALFVKNEELNSAKKLFQDKKLADIKQSVLAESIAVNQAEDSIKALEVQLNDLKKNVVAMYKNEKFNDELISTLSSEDQELFEQGKTAFAHTRDIGLSTEDEFDYESADFQAGRIFGYYSGGHEYDNNYEGEPVYRSCGLPTIEPSDTSGITGLADISLEEPASTSDGVFNPIIQPMSEKIPESTIIHSSDASFSFSQNISDLNYTIPTLHGYSIEGKGISVTNCVVKQLIAENVDSLSGDYVPRGTVNDMLELLTEIMKAGRFDAIWNQGSQ
ncbi:MAG: hypothetical protein CMP21_08465 [Rickettsiales bacterium]|mgnify:CR=1 FL=1|nr:hypothetical protein [Rickettsiales bacterium]|tara:strand:- start:9044 stop:11824 length:2781 start_codon:yes stop_codon:yes gene_type:complete